VVIIFSCKLSFASWQNRLLNEMKVFLKTFT
jgi:hypothetical protein